MNEPTPEHIEIVESTDEGTNDRVVSSKETPVLVAVPMAVAVSASDPMGTSILLTPVDDPLEEKLVHDAPLDERIPSARALSNAIPHPASANTNIVEPLALLDREEADHLRERWNEIQGKFVDDPRTAVRKADDLVSDVIEKITEIFASEHSALEDQWNQVSDISTEDLRRALQRYRSFFNRLIA